MAAARPLGEFGKEPWYGTPVGRWATELIGSKGNNQSLLPHAPPRCPPTYSPLQLYAGESAAAGAGRSAAKAIPDVASWTSAAAQMRFMACPREGVMLARELSFICVVPATANQKPR